MTDETGKPLVAKQSQLPAPVPVPASVPVNQLREAQQEAQKIDKQVPPVPLPVRVSTSENKATLSGDQLSQARTIYAMNNPEPKYEDFQKEGQSSRIAENKFRVAKMKWDNEAITAYQTNSGLGTVPQTENTKQPTPTDVIKNAVNAIPPVLGMSGVPGATAVGSASQKLSKITQDMSLADMISVHESKGNYNIFNRGAGNKYKQGEQDFSKMTVNEVLAQQNLHSKDPNRLFAVGKYQIIPKTLEEIKSKMNLTGDEKFTPELQDRMFNEHIIQKKRPKVAEAIRSGKNIEIASTEMAKEFASVGAKEKGGRSWYDGDGINKAAVSPETMNKFIANAHNKYKEALAAGKSESEAMAIATLGKTQPAIDSTLPVKPVETISRDTRTGTNEINRPLIEDGIAPPPVAPASVAPSLTPAPVSEPEPTTEEGYMKKMMNWVTGHRGADTISRDAGKFAKIKADSAEYTAQMKADSNYIEEERGTSKPTLLPDEMFQRKTLSRSIPEPAVIPGEVPPELKTAHNRVQENYRIAQNEKAAAALSAMNTTGTLNQYNGFIPGSELNGMSGIDYIRANGGLEALMNGDAAKLGEQLNPNISDTPGVQNAQRLLSAGFQQSGLQPISQSFFKQMMANKIDPSESYVRTGEIMENMSINEKQMERAQANAGSSPGNVSATGHEPHNFDRSGNYTNNNDDIYLNVRNCESSIRKLTDSILSFSFG